MGTGTGTGQALSQEASGGQKQLSVPAIPQSAVTLFTYTMVFLHVHENYEKHLQRTLDQAINELLGLSMSYFLWFPKEVWGTRYPQCDQWSDTCLTPWRIRPETAPKPARTAVAGCTTYPSKGDSDRERHSNIAEREDKNMTVKQAQEQLPDKLIEGMQIYKFHRVCSLHFYAVSSPQEREQPRQGQGVSHAFAVPSRQKTRPKIRKFV
nr:uncharacterized protein LOC106029988 isoform X2 [Anser cygnoides]